MTHTVDDVGNSYITLWQIYLGHYILNFTRIVPNFVEDMTKNIWLTFFLDTAWGLSALFAIIVTVTTTITPHMFSENVDKRCVHETFCVPTTVSL